MEQAIDADALQELHELCPLSPARREEAVALLRRARAAEERGLGTLRTLLERVGQELGQAISLNDAESVFNIAHKMKSSSSSIGALGLAHKAEQIELIGRAGKTQGTAVLLEQIKEMFADADQFLREELGK